MVLSYLARRLYSFPETEVEQDNHHSETGSQLPTWTAKIINTITVLYVEHPSSEERRFRGLMSRHLAPFSFILRTDIQYNFY